MFHSARLNLTAWYLLIIMTISILFSLVIYTNVDRELRRLEHIYDIMEMEQTSRRLLPLQSPREDIEMIAAARMRLITALGLINLAILGLAGAAGYFLAGRTLTPIQEMVDEQNIFVSDASHELKTPLTSLKSAFEVHLRNKKRTLKEADEIITESIAEVNKLQKLSESLLTLAHAPHNGTNSFVSLQLTPVLTDAIKKISPIAHTKSIVLKTEMQDATIQGNADNLTELFVILLDNAIKYSDEGKTIDVTSTLSKKTVTIAIKDRGIGIAKQNLSHIFDRFYQEDSARSKTRGGGYGLGLSIAQTIAHQHNGTIRATSLLNRGSTFTLTLPRA
jgi:signal transduction histidine kinase